MDSGFSLPLRRWNILPVVCASGEKWATPASIAHASLKRLTGRSGHRKQIVFFFFFALTKRLNFDVFQRGMLAIFIFFFFLLKRDPPGGSRLASTRTADTPTDSTPLGRISRLCPIRCVLQFVWNTFPAADWINEKLAHRWRWLQSNYFTFFPINLIEIENHFRLNHLLKNLKVFRLNFEFKKIVEISRR